MHPPARCLVQLAVAFVLVASTVSHGLRIELRTAPEGMCEVMEVCCCCDPRSGMECCCGETGQPQAQQICSCGQNPEVFVLVVERTRWLPCPEAAIDVDGGPEEREDRGETEKPLSPARHPEAPPPRDAEALVFSYRCA